MVYSYYDWLRDYYSYLDEYYDDYYESIYWPKYYNVYNISNNSWCDYIHHNITHNNTNHNHSNTLYPLNTTHSPYAMSTLTPTQFMTTFSNCTPRHNGTFPPSLYQSEQWWYTSIDTIGVSMVCITAFLAIISIILVILFFTQLKDAMKKVNRPDALTIGISSVCMIAHMFIIILDGIAFYFWFMHYNWDAYTITDMIEEITWIISKISIYSLFAYRYYMLQSASVIKTTTKKGKTLLFSTIIISIFTQIGLEIMYGFFKFDYMITGWADYEDTDFERKQRIYLNAAWTLMVIDFVLVCFLGFLIMKTILDLVVIINDPTGSSNREFTGPSAVSSTETNIDMSLQEKQRVGAMMRVQSKGFKLRSVGDWSKKSISEERKKRTSKQMNLIQTTTRIALTCTLAMISSLTVQFLWIFVEETENWGLLWTSWLWGVDAVINMLCVYFSMAFAKEQYQKVCTDICKFHHCYLWCIMKIISSQTKAQEEEVELGTATRETRVDSGFDLSDVTPLPQTNIIPDEQKEADINDKNNGN